MPDFTEVADRVWVARYDWFDVNVTLVGGRTACSWSTPTARPRGPRGGRRRPPARRRRGDRAWSTPTSTSTTPSATRSFRDGVRRAPDPRARDAARADRCAASGSSGATATTPTTRTARGPRDRDRARRPDVLLGAVARPRRPAGGAGPPGPRPHRRRPGRAGAGRRRGARRRPGRGVGPPAFGADCLPARVAAHPRHRARPVVDADGGRPGPRRAGRPGLRRGRSATTSAIVAETIRDLAGRGVPVDQALDGGRVALARSCSSTRSGAATSTCPAPEAAAAGLSGASTCSPAFCVRARDRSADAPGRYRARRRRRRQPSGARHGIAGRSAELLRSDLPPRRGQPAARAVAPDRRRPAARGPPARRGQPAGPASGAGRGRATSTCTGDRARRTPTSSRRPATSDAAGRVRPGAARR